MMVDGGLVPHKAYLFSGALKVVPEHGEQILRTRQADAPSRDELTVSSRASDFHVVGKFGKFGSHKIDSIEIGNGWTVLRAFQM